MSPFWINLLLAAVKLFEHFGTTSGANDSSSSSSSDISGLVGKEETITNENSKPERRSKINPIQQMKCILLHLHSNQFVGALLPKNKVTCSIAHSIGYEYPTTIHGKLIQISYHDILLEPSEQKITPESSIRKPNLSILSNIDGVWEGELQTSPGSAGKSWILKTQEKQGIYARKLWKTNFTFFPDNENCRSLEELKIVTEDHSGKSACEREGILVHCTASNPSSPWHNFKSDTTNWRTADGSQICTNEGGFLPWARNNVPWVKSMVAAGAVQITGTGQKVTLIGRPNMSHKP